MITSAQIRAARFALGWTAQTLAERAGVASRTVLRIEADAGLPATTLGTMQKLKTALEAAGIEFIGTPDDAPGIRIHQPAPERARDR